MKKRIIKLNESDLSKLVKKIMKESELSENFLGNLGSSITVGKNFLIDELGYDEEQVYDMDNADVLAELEAYHDSIDVKEEKGMRVEKRRVGHIIDNIYNDMESSYGDDDYI